MEFGKPNRRGFDFDFSTFFGGKQKEERTSWNRDGEIGDGKEKGGNESETDIS